MLILAKGDDERALSRCGSLFARELSRSVLLLNKADQGS